MNNFEELRNFIKNWQNENDKDFKTLPIDNHSSLIFNHENEIHEFIFSNKDLRLKCQSKIPKKLLLNYIQIIEQEKGMTYYTFDRSK